MGAGASSKASSTETGSHTVIGILGHNGRVGSALLTKLAPYNGKSLTVIILHRPSSDLSSVPKGIETRSFDLKSDDGTTFDKAVAGLHILVYVPLPPLRHLEMLDCMANVQIRSKRYRHNRPICPSPRSLPIKRPDHLFPVRLWRTMD